MSWSRPSNLIVERETVHAAHDRWIKRYTTPRWRSILDANRKAHERAQKAVGHDDTSEPNYQAALKRAYAEIGPAAEDWIENQCGGCAMYVTLDGAFGSDWGACFNPASDSDGQLRFEHDGCPQFVADLGPMTPELRDWLKQHREASAETAAE